MADNVLINQPPKQSAISTYLFGATPQYNQLPTLTPWQEAGQMGLLGSSLYNLGTGFKAPSIEPAAQEARRQFREGIVPDLMEQFAGGGSQGGLLRGLQGAGSDLQSRLAALQYEKQFELQKQRQEQLPQLLQQGFKPTFQPHLTEKQIEGIPQTVTQKLTPYGEKAKNILSNFSEQQIEKLKTNYPKIYDALSQSSKSAQEYSQSPEQFKKELAFKNVINDFEKKLPKGVQLNKSLKDTLKEQNSPLLKHLEKFESNKKKSKYLSFMNQIKNPEQLQEFIKIISKKLETTKGRDRKIAEFLARIAKENK